MFSKNELICVGIFVNLPTLHFSMIYYVQIFLKVLRASASGTLHCILTIASFAILGHKLRERTHKPEAKKKIKLKIS